MSQKSNRFKIVIASHQPSAEAWQALFKRLPRCLIAPRNDETQNY